jgi:hypothetical protein
MAIRIGAARVAVAVSLIALLLIPIAAVARSGGVGFGSPHRYRAFNTFPYGGFVTGMVSSVSYGDSNIPPLQARELPPDPPRVLTCHRSQETITVPVESGGEQPVRITRC